MFLFTRHVLAFLRVNPAQSVNQPNFFIRSACFYQSSGQPRVNPGKQEGGGVHKNRNIGEFSFRGILQPTTLVEDAMLMQNCGVGAACHPPLKKTLN